MKKYHIFYHMLNVGDCVERFEATFLKIKNSKLYDYVETINLNVVGNSSLKGMFIDPKIKVTHLSNEVNGEMDTIKYLHDCCANMQENTPILYLHSKGVTRGTNQNIKDWIDLMEYFLIERWEECIAKLKDYDTCGVNLNSELPNIKLHYSGNFWWANSDYINKLPRFDIANCTIPFIMGQPRGYCEFWLTDNTFGRHCTLHNSNIDHYCSRYSRDIYAPN